MRAFAEEKYAGSPVDVYIAPLGTAYQQIGPGYHPSAAFFDATGKPMATPEGWPGSVS